MGAKPKVVVNPGVTVIRNGQGRQEYVLPQGANLADLLREAGVDPRTQVVQIDGKPIEESVVLRPGMVVSLTSNASPESDLGDWRSTVGMFRDDPGFAAFLDRVEARRKAEDEDGAL